MFNRQVEFNSEKKSGVTKLQEVSPKTCSNNSEMQSNKTYANSSLFYPVNFMGTGRMCKDWNM